MANKPKSCLFEGCDRPNFARGYCSSHAAQLRRGGELRPIRQPRATPAEGFAYCSRCERYLDEEFFSPDKVRGGLQRVCRPCRAEYMREYNDKNRDRIRRQVTVNNWGITEEHYEALIAAQGNRCAICGVEATTKALAIDHDWNTGKARGLLHQDCNLGLGQFKDDPELLEKAAAYLRSGGVIPPELAFSVDPATFGGRRTEIRRRARLPKET